MKKGVAPKSIKMLAEPKPVGRTITRMLMTLPKFFGSTAEDLRGYGCYHMTLHEYLRAMTNGHNSGNNSQATVQIDGNNRHSNFTVNAKRVQFLKQDFCVSLLDTVYLNFHDGKTFIVINPNHRSETARQLFLNKQLEEWELQHEIKVYLIPSDFATDLKWMIDDQLPMRTSDCLRNLAYAGGSYSQQVIKAIQTYLTPSLKAGDTALFARPTWATQFNRLVQYLTYFGNTADISYAKIAHTYRTRLDQAGKTKLSFVANTVPNSVLADIVKAMFAYYELRQVSLEIGNDQTDKLFNKASFMAMYVTAVMRKDSLGIADYITLAHNMEMNFPTLLALVASSTNHDEKHVTNVYNRIVDMLTAPINRKTRKTIMVAIQLK